MSKAQKLTYSEQLRNGSIKNNKTLVYGAVKGLIFNTADINNIMIVTGLSKTEVGARLSELRKEGVIYISKTRKEGSSNYSEYRVEEDPVKIEQNRISVEKERLAKWAKQGLEFSGYLTPIALDTLKHLAY
tara:strand:+ start:8874 stop:9266 length:393 start_codon:yes stop_codon:yes gene_type:complete